jgi:RHS repeat-associated protein
VVSLELAARHYYGADDKLMAVQSYSYRSPSLSDGTWEEYGYDALGRRVLTRARRDPSSPYDALTSGPLCMGGIQCRSFTERVWWDGDQALLEQRTPEGTTDVSNSGTVGNIHGLSLDEPLAVMSDVTRIINYNWRGQGESSVFPNGSAGDASLGNTATEIDWPAATQTQTYFTPGPGSGGSGNPKRWLGTFVANGQGTTGMLYRRNRYFSPTSGQFTQADPIGIAGGMNTFGFVGGDPVNFSDPFGLCPTGAAKCSWFGNFLAGIHAGVQGLSNAPAAVDQESAWFKGGRFWGNVAYGFTHPFDNIDDAMAAAAGFNNIPIGPGSVKIGRDQYQVHAEMGGGGEGEVHVQSIRGPNKGTRYKDPSEMPRELRDNAEIQRRIMKAREVLEKLKQANR